MKKKAVITVLSVLSVSVMSLTGCSDITLEGRNGKLFEGAMCNLGGYTYSDSNLYESGDAEVEGNIKNLTIDWISGKVDISYHDKDTIVISEKANEPLTDDRCLRYRLDGDRLTIRYYQSGLGINDISKDLSVVLPKGIEFEEFEYDGVSADLYFDYITADVFKFDTTSGELVCKSITADTADFDTVSGSRTITDFIKVTNLDADSTSGSFTANEIECKDSMDFDTVSGSHDIIISRMCNISFDSTSGSITIGAPEDASFSIDYDSVSGKIDSEIPATMSGDDYTIGDGEYDLDVGTVSGDLKILLNK